MDHDTSIFQFLAACRVAGMSENTVSAYRNDLSLLYKNLPEEKRTLHGVAPDDIRSALVSLGNCAATVKRRIACYRAFFRMFNLKTADDLEVPKQAQRLPRPLQRSDLQRMIDLTPDPGERLVLELLYACGLRASELRTAKIVDGMVHVVGKGGKERVVPCTHFVREWLPKVVKRPCRRTINNVVYRAAGRARVDAAPHQLRHSFATHLMNNGCPINAISQMMGHESLCTTAGYLKMDMRAKRKCLERFHPRERTTNELIV